MAKKKNNTCLVLVETVSQFRQRYLVEVPGSNPEWAEWALETVTMEEAEEFSQKYLGETIISHRVVSEKEALEMCDEDNEYASSWETDIKKKTFFTPHKK